MVIDQRNGGNSVSGTSAVYTLDRWAVQNNSGSARFNVQQNVNAVTPPAGYNYYLGVTSTSAYTVASTDVIGINQFIEGYNTADFAWGTSSADTVTLSFWVRSSITGTFGGCLAESNAATAFYAFSYTITAANAWEQKTITIPGPTIGTWNYTNSRGIQLFFSLGTGSTYLGTANTWTASNYYAPTGSTNLVATNGATWYVTGVQFEVGNQATPFDFRDYGRELILCQRYCQVNGGVNSTQLLALSWAYSTTAAIVSCLLPVVMRATPTLTYSAVGDWAVFNGGAGGPYTCTAIALNRPSPTTMGIEFTASTLTAGQAGAVLANSTTNAKLILSAEL
jgi:hypothetical protein